MNSTSYIDWLVSVIKERYQKTKQEAVTTSSIPYYSPNSDFTQTILRDFLSYQEVKVHEWQEYTWYPGDDSDDEDLTESESNIDDIIRYLRNPSLSIEEVFDIVYTLLTDDEIELNDTDALILVAFALNTFYSRINFDTASVIDKPYQLFFGIYRYFFSTHSIPTLLVGVLLLYAIQHNKIRDMYLASFGSITLNNQKNLLALLSLLKYVSIEDLYEIVIENEDDFFEFYKSFLVKLAEDETSLRLFGINPSDFRALLVILTEDRNVMQGLYTLIFNQGLFELCKHEVIHLLTGDIKNEHTTKR